MRVLGDISHLPGLRSYHAVTESYGHERFKLPGQVFHEGTVSKSNALNSVTDLQRQQKRDAFGSGLLRLQYDHLCPPRFIAKDRCESLDQS